MSITPSDMCSSTEESFFSLPRAVIAIDLSRVTPVPMQGPTVIGNDDPYQSIKPTMVMAATRVGDNAPPPGALTDTTSTPLNANGPDTAASGPTSTDGTVRVLRAEPAGALDSTREDDSTIHLDPPAPIKF